MSFNHTTVLLEESINNLNIKPNGIYVDATLGGAGHSKLIHSKLSKEGTLIVFDQDIWAINNAKSIFKDVENVIIVFSNFSNLKKELLKLNILKIDGILFDLGVSSMQIDNEERGFSYRYDGPLDMRMDQNAVFKAQDIIDNYPLAVMISIFDKYGEEKNSKRIARAIMESRNSNRIDSTKKLNDLILESIPKKDFYNAKSHPSKRVFQALRIEVNKELDVFEDTLKECYDLMNIGGRISVITFHSLEDRICKYYFKKWASISDELRNMPVIPDEYLEKYKLITRKPIKSNDVELKSNSRSASAKLRVVERIR